MHFAVTGGAGFIGNNIVKNLVKKKHSVCVIDNLNTGKLENLKAVRDKVDFFKIDIRNFDKVKKFFTKDYKPYVIGKIISGKNKIKLNLSLLINEMALSPLSADLTLKSSDIIIILLVVYINYCYYKYSYSKHYCY